MHERRFKKPLRYKGHDYRAPCSVHVTICTHMRQPLFGNMAPTGMLLSDAGHFVEATLLGLHAPEAGIEVDTPLVMPDHLHAIIHLGTHPTVVPTFSVSDLIASFKMRVLKSWPGGIRYGSWPRYDTHLWQPSFHDILIRNDKHLDITRAYILANPARWIERMESSTNP
jgi:REP element-mobilizing transposase RayT